MKITAKDLLAEVRKSHKGATGELILKHKEYEEKVINLSKILLNNNTLRNCSEKKVKKYIENLKNGDTFPPAIVNSNHVLIDGYHRVMANSSVGNKMIKVYFPLI